MTATPSGPARRSNEPLPLGHELTEGEPHHAVVVYGTNWCEDTTRARELLETIGIEYNYYNTELDAAMARTASSLQNGGTKTPVIDFGENRILVEPENDAIIDALRESGRIK